MLVDGKESCAVMVDKDGLGAVAVVDIEIKDGHAVGAGGECLEGGNGHRIQIAEAHGLIARGVMPGRTHEAEDGFASAGKFKSVQRGTGTAAGVIGDAVEVGRFGVEINRLREAHEMTD